MQLEGSSVETDSIVDILTRLQVSRDNSTSFSENWSQGRSAFGGLTAAMAVTAMRKLLEQDKPLRSLMVSFIAPVPAGEIEAKAQLQRSGKNVSQISADLLIEEQPVLQAMGIFGSSRDTFNVAAEPKKSLPSRQTGIAFSEHSKRLPKFLQYLDGAWMGESLPFSGKLHRSMQMWVKHKIDMGDFRAEQLVSIADMPPPVILTAFKQPPVPASSLTWSLEFVKDPEIIETDWFFLDFTLEAAADGYTQQSGRIYTETGELCALSRQCMVYFG